MNGGSKATRDPGDITPGFFLACQQQGTLKPGISGPMTVDISTATRCWAATLSTSGPAGPASEEAPQALGADVAEERELVAS